MTLSINPPPLQVPPEFAENKLQNAFFSGLLNTIYQMWTTLYGLQTTARVTTNNADVTALLRVSVREGTTSMIKAEIVGRRTGGSAGSAGDSAFYTLTGAYKNVGGTLTGIGSPVLQGGEDVAAWNVGFDTSGESAIVTVKGETNYDITWEGAISVYVVGS